MTHQPWPVLAEAHQLLRAAADQTGVAQLDLPTPCSAWSVAQVVHHATLDQLIWSSLVGGTPGPDGDAFAPRADLSGTAAELVEPALATSAGVWSEVSPGATVPTPLPQGPMPVDTAVRACALDAAVHAWDIAVATGQPSPLTTALAQELTPTAHALTEPLRQWGAYATALPARPGDQPADLLLKYLGRDPHWHG